MSYEDLEGARAKRREKEAIKEAEMRKRSQNVHISTQEKETSEHDIEPSKALDQARSPVEQMSDQQLGADRVGPTPWRAPEARIW